MSDCRVCSTPDSKKPQIFRGEDHCCDRHRKVIAGEVKPTHDEKMEMRRELYEALGFGGRRRPHKTKAYGKYEAKS